MHVSIIVDLEVGMNIKAIIFCAIASAALKGRTLEKVLQVSIVEERVNGDLYTHRMDTVDGVQTQRWLINGKEVDEAKYEDRLAQADALERKQERDKQKRMFQYKHASVNRLQRDILQRTLKDLLYEIKQQLAKVSDYRLRNYLHFSDDSIQSLDELDRLHNQLVAQADDLLRDQESALSSVQSMITQLENYPERLALLFNQSVEQACAHSDDTRLLKDLLNCISVE